MRVSFELHFYRKPLLTLERTKFVCTLLEGTRVSVRGKSAWGIRSTGSFEWSAAVRSLAKLIVSAAANPDFELLNLDAKTLDFALAKDPVWLREMFCDQTNSRFTKRLFLRSNPEGRRAVTQSVKLNPYFWGEAKIAVFVEGVRLTENAELLTIAKELGRNKTSQARAIELVEAGFSAEIRMGLERPQVLEDRHFQNLGKFYARSSYINSLGSSPLLNWMTTYRSTNLPGLSKAEIIKELQGGAPIAVLTPPTCAGNAALIYYLRDKWKLPIKIVSPYATAYNSTGGIVNGELGCLPEVFSSGIIPACNLLTRPQLHDYQPFAPGLQGLGGLINSDCKNYSRIFLYKDQPNNTSLMAELTHHSRIELISLSHSQIIQAAIIGELKDRALVIGIFNGILPKLGISVIKPTNDPMSEPLFLFLARREFASSRRGQVFAQALRRGFAAMLFDNHALKGVLKSMLQDELFVYHVMNEGGLFGVLGQ